MCGVQEARLDPVGKRSDGRKEIYSVSSLHFRIPVLKL